MREEITMKAPRRRYWAGLCITLCLMFAPSAGNITAVRAQDTPAGKPSPAAATGAGNGATPQPVKAAMPEVQILIAPMPGAQPGSQWLVSTVYAKKVPQSEAETRGNRLLQLTGWQAADESFSDRALESAPLGKGRKAPVLSSLTFRTNGQVVNFADGTIAVEPFLLAYRDLSRVHVTVLNPGPFTYRGLRSYEDDNIQILLNAGQGAWTYIANIKNHRAERFNLPRYHTEQPPTAAGGRHDAGISKPLLFCGLALLALIVGGLAFTLVRRLMTN